MSQEPRGFHAATEGTLKLPGADSLFTATHQVEGLQPDLQGNVAGLEHRSHADGELLTAGIALPQAGTDRLTQQPAGLTDDATMRAEGLPLRPQLGFNIGEGGFFVVEMKGGKLGFHSGLLLSSQTTFRGWVCQV